MTTRAKPSHVLVLAAAALLAAGAAWAAGLFGSGGKLGPATASAAALEPFDSCDEMLDYVRDHRWALGGGYAATTALEFGRATDALALAEDSDSAVPATGDGAIGPNATGTNVQEAGIDEPDLAKLAGDTLWVVSRGTLESYDVAAPDPVLEAELDLGARFDSEPQLILADERALVIVQTSSRPDYRPLTWIAEIDIADPAAPTVIRTAEIEGAYVNARLRGSTAHLVVASTPDYPVEPAQGRGDPVTPVPLPALELPQAPSGATGEEGPEPEAPTEPVWLPEITITNAATGEAETRPLLACDSVSYPERFAGLGLVSVLTIDTQTGLPAVDTDTVMTNGSTVYASAESVYVATETMRDPAGGVLETLGRAVAPDVVVAPSFPGETAIHRFDVTDPTATSYRASGEVAGRILNEWSLSEHDGLLRVAATEGDPWAEGAGESETVVSVLAERDGELERIGRAGGLGRGESIFGVRFIGEMGYVVTFEQTDPLYTVDLSDPERPRTTGELKIPGYSAYLHPVGDERLLGIGQAGTDDGRLTGAQASLFDVGDATQPKRIDTLGLLEDRYGSAEAEWDSHAFLYWPEARLAVVPVASYGRGKQASAVAFRVTEDGALVSVAELRDTGGQIRRMLVAKDRLLTVTERGVTSRPLADLGA